MVNFWQTGIAPWTPSCIPPVGRVLQRNLHQNSSIRYVWEFGARTQIINFTKNAECTYTVYILKCARLNSENVKSMGKICSRCSQYASSCGGFQRPGACDVSRQLRSQHGQDRQAQEGVSTNGWTRGNLWGIWMDFSLEFFVHTHVRKRCWLLHAKLLICISGLGWALGLEPDSDSCATPIEMGRCPHSVGFPMLPLDLMADLA